MVSHVYNILRAELTDDNWKEVNGSIRERTRDPSWYRHVVRDVCCLETQVGNLPWFMDWDEEYFTGVLRMEKALELHDAENNNNHLGTVHASAQFALAEACSGQYLLKTFKAYSSKIIPVVRKAETKYQPFPI